MNRGSVHARLGVCSGSYAQRLSAKAVMEDEMKDLDEDFQSEVYIV
jgi:hypothetical protein